jgi:hypothetical protein
LVFVSKRIPTTANEDDLLATLELFVFAPTGGIVNAKEGDIVITIPMTFNVIVVTIIIKKDYYQ